MPFTLRNLRRDADDVGSNFDGSPDREFRLAGNALELEHSGLSYQRIPPDYRFPYGHAHKTQEEVFVVLRGGGRMKLDELLVIGAPSLGDSPRDDVEGTRDWWSD